MNETIVDSILAHEALKLSDNSKIPCIKSRHTVQQNNTFPWCR